MLMRIAGLLLFAAAGLFFPGCVERGLVITSEPSGADVTVNQQWKGKTPYVLPFKHYGVYDIWIEHPGYEENGKLVKFYPLHAAEPVKAPKYQYIGADFVSEVLLPVTLRDQREIHYRLERVEQADETRDILARAGQLREASRVRTAMRAEKDADRRTFRPPLLQEKNPGSGEEEETGDGPNPEDSLPLYSEPLDVYPQIDATPPSPDQMPVFQ